MPSRDIWSPGAGTVLADAVSSLLVMLLLRSDDTRAVYFSSPWITDFPLCSNRFREFSPLFPELADEDEIKFSDYLARLARERDVRILTVRTEQSKAFLANPKLAVPRLQWRFANGPYHEKGILGPDCYVEGSMNLTFKGVFINREKLTIHAGRDTMVSDRIAAAYLEFDRHWEALDGAE